MSSYAVAGTAGSVLPANPPPRAREDVRERAPDLFGATTLGQGQIVVVVARWILVLAGLMLAIWNPARIPELRLQLVVLLSLAVANFFLHAQLLMRKPVRDWIVYLASAADVAVVTALILAQHGFASDLYIFYYVAILAAAVAFPKAEIVLGTAATMAVYALIGLGSLDTPEALQHGTADQNFLLLVARLVVLGAVAFCGGLYRHLERTRRLARAVESAEDLFFGQVAIIWARWFVILASAVVVLWTASSEGELAAKILIVLALMALNFFLHGRALLDKPANARVVLAASVLDLALVTAMVALWRLGAPGLWNGLFVLYYPVLLAFAFVFRPRLAVGFTAAAVAVYALTCLVADPTLGGDPHAPKVLVARLVTLAATGGLGAYYWRILREERRAARQQPSLGM